MANWKIGSRGGTCGRCERGFAEGERHVSTLVLNEEAQLWREDLCPDCWTPSEGSAVPRRAVEDAVEADAGAVPESGPEPPCESGAETPVDPESGSTAGGPAEPLFWWFTRYREQKKKTLQLDLAALEQIFVSLEGREEEPVRELRYLLCLILMRKRRVKLEKLERGPAGESFLVKRPRRDQRYRVFVYDFSPERTDELRAQLQALFDGADLETGVNLTADGPGQVEGDVDQEIADEAPPGGGEGEASAEDEVASEDEASAEGSAIPSA